MGFMSVVDISDSSAEIAESAALTCLASFKKIDEHYTYILQSDVPASAGKDGNNEDDNNEEVAGADEERMTTSRSDRVGDGLLRASDERGSLMSTVLSWRRAVGLG
mmetsp:Transcript_9263/g.13892  ORF Transcript_9263/g.13892 Transcript_9263/m.13892 type:complete len:106 (-) Transcript_9263:113-430(-)